MRRCTLFQLIRLNETLTKYMKPKMKAVVFGFLFALVAILWFPSSSWAQFDIGDTSGQLDTDGDGVPDIMELVGDYDGDSLQNFEDPDDDNDGVLTRDELSVGATTVLFDTDGDKTPDYLDTDDDSDGYRTAFEISFGGGDFDGDGTPNHRDTDDDNDGILSRDEFFGDTDGNRIIDAFDVDDDGDGFSTLAEGSSTTLDLNNNGRADYLDDNAPGLARLSQAFVETSTGATATTSVLSPNISGPTRDDDSAQIFGDIDPLNGLTANVSASPTFTGTVEEFAADTSGESVVLFPSDSEFILSHRFNLSGQNILPFGFVSSKTVFAESVYNMAFELSDGATFDIDLGLQANFTDPNSRLTFTLDDVVLFSLSAQAGNTVQASLKNEFLAPGIHVVSVGYDSVLPILDSEIQGPFQFTADADVSLLRSAVTVPEPSALALFGIGCVGFGVLRRRRVGLVKGWFRARP